MVISEGNRSDHYLVPHHVEEVGKLTSSSLRLMGSCVFALLVCFTFSFAFTSVFCAILRAGLASAAPPPESLSRCPANKTCWFRTPKVPGAKAAVN